MPGNDESIAEEESKNDNENDEDKDGAGENGDDDEDEVGAENEEGRRGDPIDIRIGEVCGVHC